MDSPSNNETKNSGNTTGSKIVSNYYEKLKAEFEIKTLSVSLSDLETMIRKIVREELTNAAPTREKEPTPHYLSIKEAAKYLHLAVATIYEKTSARLIPFHKRDKKLYFVREELDEWLNGTSQVKAPNTDLPISIQKAA